MEIFIQLQLFILGLIYYTLHSIYLYTKKTSFLSGFLMKEIINYLILSFILRKES